MEFLFLEPQFFDAYVMPLRLVVIWASGDPGAGEEKLPSNWGAEQKYKNTRESRDVSIYQTYIFKRGRWNTFAAVIGRP